ncbi:hypothetical protein JTB14_037613 [Gonioctena quinquepunctata]|nr:hypothetical protein JTB14_037613 [Gonioctena quinquepunctata]
MFLFPFILGGVENLATKGDYPPGTSFRPNTTYMDIFMALFMVCAIEVVVLKIMVFDESQAESQGTGSTFLAESFSDRM